MFVVWLFGNGLLSDHCDSARSKVHVHASTDTLLLFAGPECNEFQFQCLNVGQPLASPQCIAVYDACDGINHCADKSDEMDCEQMPTATTGETCWEWGLGRSH